MDTSGQAAEQVVRLSLEGIAYTLKLSGKGAERLTAALLALAGNQEQLKGRTTLHAMLKTKKELKVFTIPNDRLREFVKETKRFGVLYCVLKERKPGPDAMCDLLVRAEDAAKINRIIERLGLTHVAETSMVDTGPQNDPIADEIQAAGDLLEQILTPIEQEQENPTMAQTESSDLSGHGSNPSELITEPKPADTPITNRKPSVRAALAKIRQNQKAAADLEQAQRTAEDQLTQIIGKER